MRRLVDQHERHRDYAIKRADHEAVDQKLDQELEVHAVPRRGVAGLFPSPLVGEGGFAKRRRVRGSLRIAVCETVPLTQLSLGRPAAMPSPTRGEGASIGTAMCFVLI